jgi:DNA-binding MarR family transcriptional regulator
LKRKKGAQKGDRKMRLLANSVKKEGRDLTIKTLVSILRTADMINLVIDLASKQHGINQTMLSILYTLTTHEGVLTPTDLSKKVFRTKQAITLAVDGLEAAGLVKRETVGTDRRIRRIRTTEKSSVLIKNTLAARRKLIYSIMSCLQPEEAENMFRILEKLMEEMPKHIELAKETKAGLLKPIS